MPTKFEEVAKWGAQWVGTEAWQKHTVDEAAANKLVAGYMRFLDKLAGTPHRQIAALGPAIDIGCGAGYISNAFRQFGFSVVGTEYGEDTVAFARSMQPDLEIRDVDLSNFVEEGAYGFIFTREVYLFTRVGDFEQQYQVLSNLVESLRPGGVVLLVASDRLKPDCLDFARTVEAFRADPRVASVTTPCLEPVFKHLGALIFGRASYNLLMLALAPYIALQKWRKKWAPSLMIALVRAK